MIDREYYPLAMAAKILECSEDDLNHLAATQKIKIHVLTDRYMCTRYDTDEAGEFFALPKYALVHYPYFESLEVNIDANPTLTLEVPEITIKKSRKNGDESFNVDITYPSFMAYPPFLNGEGEELATLGRFVILDDELTIIKSLDAPPKKIVSEESGRNTMLKLILGMAIDAYGYSPEKKQNSATGNNNNGISSRLSTHGIDITNETIKKYLDEAKKLI